jgi:hypothetical protein
MPAPTRQCRNAIEAGFLFYEKHKLAKTVLIYYAYLSFLASMLDNTSTEKG